MKRIVFPMLFLGVVALVLFVTVAPLTPPEESGFGVDVPGLFGLETITPTPRMQDTATDTPAPTLLPTTATPSPTVPPPTPTPESLFDPLDQEYFREYVRGAGADDCIKIDDNRIWDECFDMAKVNVADWPYHILAYEPESYMRNFEVPGGPRSDAGWIFGPVDQPWPLIYSGDIEPEKLNTIFTCSIVSGDEVLEGLWTDPDRARAAVERRDLRILSLVPITKANFNKFVTYSPLLSRFPSFNYRLEKTKKCGDFISTFMP